LEQWHQKSIPISIGESTAIHYLYRLPCAAMLGISMPTPSQTELFPEFVQSTPARRVGGQTWTPRGHDDGRIAAPVASAWRTRERWALRHAPKGVGAAVMHAELVSKQRTLLGASRPSGTNR